MARDISLLDQCKIASPCDVGWAHMQGDDRVRFCNSCSRHVYNLSAMTRREAEDLIREKEGRMCVSIYRRLDGTVLTADCPVGVRRARLALARLMGIGASIVGACFAMATMLGLPNRVSVQMQNLEPFSRLAQWLRPPPIPLPPGGRSDGGLFP